MSAVGQFRLCLYEEAPYCDLGCAKCGGIVITVDDGITLDGLLLQATEHECLPEIRKGFG